MTGTRRRRAGGSGPAVRAVGLRSLAAGFHDSVERFPTRPALDLAASGLTYDELAGLVRSWAGALAADIDRPPRRVGVLAERGSVAYGGVLAALTAGATYVPLNTTLPVERTSQMIEIAGLDTVIAGDRWLPRLAEALALAGSTDHRRVRVLSPDSDRTEVDGWSVMHRSAIASAPDWNAEPARPRGEPAYLVFTSGSTGRPKGVPILHDNVGHYLERCQERYGLTEHDRLSQTTDLTFDLSLFDMFMAWNVGACVCAMGPLDLLAPARYVVERGLTVWLSVPSVVARARAQDNLAAGSMPTLRWSLFCGEALPRESAEAWQEAAPHTVVENIYGPTETTITCFAHGWDPVISPARCENGTVPIGRPLPGLEWLLLDDEQCEVEEGTEGELCIGGPQTFAGYWRDPDRSARVLFERPGPGGEPVCYYRTGDLVRQLDSGDLIYLGRIDDQLKVRGYRTEPAGIEAVLRQAPGVVDAVAIGWPIRDFGADGIVAFVSGRDIDVDVVRATAERTLPRYIVPREVHVLDEMPLNVNGKIDRRALVGRLEGGVG